MMRPLAVLMLGAFSATAFDTASLEVKVETGQPLPGGPVYNAAVVASGDRIYIVGGQESTEEGVLDDLGFVATAHWIEPSTGAEGSLPDYPFPVSGAQAAVLDGTLFVTGGNVPVVSEHYWVMEESAAAVGETWDVRFGGSNIVAAAYRLDLSKPRAGWKQMAHLRVPRTNHAMVVIEGALVAIGGNYFPQGLSAPLPFDPSLQECNIKDDGGLDTCAIGYSEVYRPRGDRWAEERRAHLLVPRNLPMVAAHAGTVVVTGGTTYGGDANALPNAGSLAEILVPGAEGFEWAEPPPVAVFTGRGAGSSSVLWFYSHPVDHAPAQLLGFVPAQGTWVHAELDLTWVYAGLVTAGGALHVLGGIGQGAILDRLITLDPILVPRVSGGCGGSVASG